MKTDRLITTVLVLLFTVTSLTAQEKKNKDLTTVSFITSIDCENCVNTIMKNIPYEKGVKDVECNLETGAVTIQYQKEKNNNSTLKRAIEKLGYTAKEVTDKDKKGEQKKEEVEKGQ